MKISIIVPCYNEEAALPIFYKDEFISANGSYQHL